MPVDDKQLIQQTIQVYFDSMYCASKDKVNEAFHPSAMITGEFGGKFTEMTRDAFGDFVASQQPSPKDKGEKARLEILNIDIAGPTAVTRVRDDYLGFTFLDTLSLVKNGDQWSIYNKLYHIEGDAS
ncbi:MAG: nuclear transport factor 2 family protein [Rhodospirillales bacterium]|nr:nuclear transport factor 2 family protein [Rhodospirillales bacterium]